MTNPDYITIDQLQIALTRKSIKNLHLRVHPPAGQITISAPHQLAMPVIEAFVRSKLPWIRQQQAQHQQYARLPETELLERESHYVWGARYLLHLQVGTRYHIEQTPTQLVLTAPAHSTNVLRAAYLQRWYRQQLLAALPPLLATWPTRMGVQVNRLFVQQMKTRWGSCNHRAGHIRLNTELAKHAPHLLEYVLVHELVHLLEPSHNKRFYALLGQFWPSWQSDRQQLRSGLGMAH
jgi:predicted metal-dependent hydrolase